MCLKHSNIKGVNKWNWDGDVILHNAIVPSSRFIPGTRKQYNIDVREFLVSEDNTVISKVLHKEIRKYVERIGENWEYFRDSSRGSFDYKANIVWQWVSHSIGYAPSGGRDPWLFPDETLSLRKGDCEDI